jgi:disulfide oxidoreductase YuzD
VGTGASNAEMEHDDNSDDGTKVGITEQYLREQVARWYSGDKFQSSEIDLENNPYEAKMDKPIGSKQLVEMLMIKVQKKRTVNGRKIIEDVKNELGQTQWLCLICKNRMINKARGYQNLSQHLKSRGCCGSDLHTKYHYYLSLDMNEAMAKEAKKARLYLVACTTTLNL